MLHDIAVRCSASIATDAAGGTPPPSGLSRLARSGAGRSLALTAAAGALIAACADQPAPEASEVVVLDPAAEHFGASLAEWGAVWWTWALSLPLEGHPLLDETGADCGNGQAGDVFFLAGTFGGEVSRTCAIPADKAVLFPVINFAMSNAGVPEEFHRTPLELASRANELLDTVVEMSVTIDGRPVDGLEAHRGEAAFFTVTLPEEDNLFDFFGAEPRITGVIDPAFASGFWVLLAPLPPGEHTIAFSASREDGFTTGVTYTVQVD